MGMPKGRSGNPKGRTPGIPNKVTRELRERFKEFAEGNFDNCQEWLDRTAEEDPAEAMRLFLALTERVIGKLTTSSVDITSNGEALRPPNLIVPPARPESESQTG